MLDSRPRLLYASLMATKLQMTVKLSAVPGEGLTDFVAMVGGNGKPFAAIYGTDEDDDFISLLTIAVAAGSDPMLGIATLSGGLNNAMPFYLSQADELTNIQRNFLKSTLNTSSQALLTAPNGDAVEFSFVLPEGYAYDEIAAVQGDRA